MPIIELDGTQSDPARVFAVMLFPNDPALRQQFVKARNIDGALAELDAGAPYSLTAGELRVLLAGPRPAEFQKAGEDAVKGGSIAGDVLAAVYLMDVFQDRSPALREPSFGKAVEVAMKFGLGRKFGDGEPLPYSDATIRKKWAKFKPVAHLWAAARINLAYPFCEDGEWFRSVEACHQLLRVAAGLFNFGIAYIPKRAKPPVPILDAGSAWIIPESFSPVALQSERMPDQLVEYLKSYKAA